MTGSAVNAAALLDRAVERAPLDGHDGRSGALLERVLLDDGTRLVVKRTSPAVDLVMRRTGAAVSREYRLWQSGVLGRLPLGVGHALVDAWVDGEETVLVMRDLGAAVVGWDRRLSRDEARRLLGAVTSLHRAFRGGSPALLCPLVDRISVFRPDRMAQEADVGNPLAVAVRRGWERFAEIVPPEVAAEVMAMLARPERLAGPLSRRPCTLIHGDLWLVNVAFEPAQVTLLDWDLATWAPPPWSSPCSSTATRRRSTPRETRSSTTSAASEGSTTTRLGWACPCSRVCSSSGGTRPSTSSSTAIPRSAPGSRPTSTGGWRRPATPSSSACSTPEYRDPLR